MINDFFKLSNAHRKDFKKSVTTIKETAYLSRSRNYYLDLHLLKPALTEPYTLYIYYSTSLIKKFTRVIDPMTTDEHIFNMFNPVPVSSYRHVGMQLEVEFKSGKCIL